MKSKLLDESHGPKNDRFIVGWNAAITYILASIMPVLTKLLERLLRK
jgi:hypothetical protein